MRIVYLMQAGAADLRQRPLSGPSLHVRAVFDGLRSRGHEMLLLAVFDGRIFRSADLESFAPVAVPWLDGGPLRLLESAVRRLQKRWHLPYAGFFESLHFAAACRQEARDCDVLYERMGWLGYGGALTARALRIPLVLEINGDHLAELAALGAAPSGATRRLALAVMRFATRSAAHAVATGEGWRARHRAMWGIAADRVTTVENGTDLLALCRRERLRCHLPAAAAGEPVTIAFLGTFDPWQGVDVLIRAFAAAVRRGTAARLVLIGTGRGRGELAALCGELGVADRVELTGHLPLPEVARHLEAADIGIAPYRQRANFSGLKILDYKAAGLAIIASGGEGQAALLAHGHSGWIVPPGDVTALSAALATLCADAALRRRLGSTARREAEERHAWSHTAARIEALLESVVAARRGAAG